MALRPLRLIPIHRLHQASGLFVLISPRIEMAWVLHLRKPKGSRAKHGAARARAAAGRVTPAGVNLKKAIRPQVMQINTNGSVPQPECADQPEGEHATHSKPLLGCIHLRRLSCGERFSYSGVSARLNGRSRGGIRRSAGEKDTQAASQRSRVARSWSSLTGLPR
jgi:hypothetical protein